MVTRQRLRVGDIEGGTCKPVRFQRLQQCSRIDRSPPSHIDKIRFPRKPGTKEFASQHAASRLRQRQRIDDHVRIPGKLEHLVGQADIIDEVRAIARAVASRDNPHAQRGSAPRYLGANAAEPENQHGLALHDGHTIGVAPVALPGAIPHAICKVWQFSRQRQQHGNRMFCNDRG